VLLRVANLLLAALLTVHTAAPGQERSPVIRVAERGGELVVEYGPLTAHAGAGHGEAHEPPPAVFQLPADGWMRGYVVDLVDSAGRALPRSLLHHINLIAKDQRELFSPVMLRLGAAGRETRDILLPRPLGVRGRRGDKIIMTLMLHDDGGLHHGDVWVRLRIRFVRSTWWLVALPVYPVSVAIGPKEQPNTFDLPPGRSEHYWEGSPAVGARILGLSGHLHRYGVSLRLENRTNGSVLWEIRPKSDSAGDVREMGVSLFLWRLGKSIRPDHVYRLTAVYDNPEPRTIPNGGMGVIGGVVLLTGERRWPRVDPSHPEYVVDLQSILRGGASENGGRESYANPSSALRRDQPASLDVPGHSSSGAPRP
jgi:hypothetical protein